MKSYNEVVALAQEIVVGDALLNRKYTKTESLRQRLVLGKLKNLVAEARRDLVAKDVTVTKKKTK